MTHERLADGAQAVAWTLLGISIVHLNEVLQSIALITASICSVCAAIYYYRKSRKRRYRDE